jgi:mitochondrial translocator assembly and maintenance protein 41
LCQLLRCWPKLVKYGVIETEDLLDDLYNWTSFYCAGRFQKPVLVLKSDAQVQAAVDRNLLSALAMGILLSPERYSDQDLFVKIAGLSYLGDVRMRFAENPKKVGIFDG